MLSLLLAVTTAQPSRAADDIVLADLVAAVRAIGFLDSLPRDGMIFVGVVYSDSDGGKAKALQVAAELHSMQGPNNEQFRVVPLLAKDLAQSPGRLDAVVLMPNQASADIADAVRRRRVVSISTDPGCLDSKCCVLMVRTEGRVRVVLDTGLADVVGARFSPIFLMMVERR